MQKKLAGSAPETATFSQGSTVKDIKPTRDYQEACQEGIQIGEQRGKLEVVPILLELRLSAEQIAERLHLDLEQVQAWIQSSED